MLVEVSDAAGNLGRARSSILLDTTPPIVIVGIQPGQTCDLCQPLMFAYVVTDPSGVGSAISSIDGTPIENGGLIDGYLFAAGQHTIRISVVDLLGNAGSVSLNFEVHASIEGLICAVHRAVHEGTVAGEQENPLIAKLQAAQASRDRGGRTPETNQLQAFIHDLQAQSGKKIQTPFAARAMGWTQDLIDRIASGKA